MQAYLVIEDSDGEEVKRITLDDRGGSKNYKKLGAGQFDRKNGSDAVVVQVYYDREEWEELVGDSEKEEVSK